MVEVGLKEDEEVDLEPETSQRKRRQQERWRYYSGDSGDGVGDEAVYVKQLCV